jgi:hypothetical protein
VAFILCELAIRHIPPDGASLTRLNDQTSLDNSGPGSVTATTRIYTSPRDRAIIDKLNNALNTAPLQLPAPLLKGCQNGLGGAVTFTVTLTWHGLPVQVWTSEGCGAYSESSGGITNFLWTHELPWRDQAALLP